MTETRGYPETLQAEFEDATLKGRYSTHGAQKALEFIRRQPAETAYMKIKILSWLVRIRDPLAVHRGRPGSPTVDYWMPFSNPTLVELRIAVSLQKSNFEFDRSFLLDQFEFLAVFAGLVKIDGMDNTIQLASETIYRYLQKNLDPKLLKSADFELAMACTTYLTLDAFEACFGDANELEGFQFEYPFLNYATTNLEFSLRRCDQNLSKDMILRFLSRSGCLNSYLQTHHTLMYSRNPYSSEVRFLEPRSQLALRTASAFGHFLAIKVILEDVVDVSARNHFGSTALHIATAHGDVEIIKLLLEHGADVTLTDNRGYSALDMTSGYFEVPLDVIQLLLEQVADPAITKTLVDSAFETAANKNDLEVTKFFFEKGARLATHDNNEMPWPLCCSVIFGRLEMTRYLLEIGSKFEFMCALGTPLQHAIRCENAHEMVSLLLESGADPCFVGPNGLTPLDLAVRSGKLDLIKLLLDYRADWGNTTALDIATARGREDIVQLLKAYRS